MKKEGYSSAEYGVCEDESDGEDYSKSAWKKGLIS